MELKDHDSETGELSDTEAEEINLNAVQITTQSLIYRTLTMPS